MSAPITTVLFYNNICNAVASTERNSGSGFTPIFPGRAVYSPRYLWFELCLLAPSLQACVTSAGWPGFVVFAAGAAVDGAVPMRDLWVTCGTWPATVSQSCIFIYFLNPSCSPESHGADNLVPWSGTSMWAVMISKSTTSQPSPAPSHPYRLTETQAGSSHVESRCEAPLSRPPWGPCPTTGLLHGAWALHCSPHV